MRNHLKSLSRKKITNKSQKYFERSQEVRNVHAPGFGSQIKKKTFKKRGGSTTGSDAFKAPPPAATASQLSGPGSGVVWVPQFGTE